MEGRLCLLEYSNYDDNNSAYKLRIATFLSKSFPADSVVYANARESNGSNDSYVGWTIVVVSPHPRSKQQWKESWDLVEQQILLGYNSSGDCVEVVEVGQELQALARWKDLMQLAGNRGTVRTGSVENIRKAIGLVEKTSECYSAALRLPDSHLQECYSLQSEAGLKEYCLWHQSREDRDRGREAFGLALQVSTEALFDLQTINTKENDAYFKDKGVPIGIAYRWVNDIEGWAKERVRRKVFCTG